MRWILFLALATVAIAQMKEADDELEANTLNLLSDVCNRTVEHVTRRVDAVHLRVGNKRYHFNFYFKANFFLATEFCRYHGMHLATIESKYENDALQAYMTALGYGFEPVWISGNNLGGSYIWMSTGTPMVYKNFMPGQPSNPQVEHCIEILRNGQWNDAPCVVPKSFVCQY